MADDAKWYVVHTYSGYEAKVAATILSTVENRKLQDLIFEVNIPMEMVTELKDSKNVEVERKLFPGYVLVKMIMTDERRCTPHSPRPAGTAASPPRSIP